MATDDRVIAGRRAAFTGFARVLAAQAVTMTVAGNTTVKGSVTLPAGSWLEGIALSTPVAISGTPTSTLFRAGITDGGQDIVADVDNKGQGNIAATIVASFDKLDAVAAANVTVFFQLTTTGGTSSAGEVDVVLKYYPPIY